MKKPDQQFQMMIAGLLESRQSSVSTQDIIRHNGSDINYYIISEITMEGTRIVKQTQPFSEGKMMEIKRGGSQIYIGDDQHVAIFEKVTAMEFTLHESKGLVFWTVKNKHREIFTVVKLMSPDGYLQIKLIHPNQTTQLVYMVCELPKMR